MKLGTINKCNAVDCDQPVKHREYCNAHYQRWLHGEFDQQTYLEMSRLDNDPPDDAEFCVNVTAKQLRAINQAILKAEGKL